MTFTDWQDDLHEALISGDLDKLLELTNVRTLEQIDRVTPEHAKLEMMTAASRITGRSVPELLIGAIDNFVGIDNAI